ncbi:unnamed protein product [Spirodela intermedia]|uniref:Uncharacterized protein n=1 Tax=Spirodela intermedia TaxID=51605 RepID=A0A7I8K2V5_SPIIN|nr:unnamed protein product [Spirodela intermedia]
MNWACSLENELESGVFEEIKLTTDVDKVEPSKNEVQDIQTDEKTVLVLDNTDKEEENESEEVQEAEEDVESESSDSFICDSEDGLSEDETNDGLTSEVPLTDAEVEELITEFLDVESKAAEAQESLEKESLAQVESEVKAELSEKFQGEELETAVLAEMKIYIEQWKSTLDELETESSLLLEQLDGAGVELPKLYRLIESQVADCCSTEAWKRRAHWVGCQLTSELDEAINDAEKYLQSCRPVRRRHGRVMEEGASGFLAKKLTTEEHRKGTAESSDQDWSSFTEVLQSSRSSENGVSFGSKNWASVYLASTPQQASLMGLKLPGVDEVEEIDEIPIDSCDPFYADAIANEKAIDLSEEQRRNFRKLGKVDVAPMTLDENDVKIESTELLMVKNDIWDWWLKRGKSLDDYFAVIGTIIVREEEDAKFTRKLQLHLKKRRQQRKSFQKDIRDQSSERDLHCAQHGKKISSEVDDASTHLLSESVLSDDTREGRHTVNGSCSTSRECKRVHAGLDPETDNKRCRTLINDDDDDDVQVLEKIVKDTTKLPKMDSQPTHDVKESVDVIDVDSVPSPCPSHSKDYSENFHCTVCCKVLSPSEVCRHPLLEVISCKTCHRFMKERLHHKKVFVDGVASVAIYQLKQLVMDCDKALNRFAATGSDISSESSDSDIDHPISNKKRRKKRIRRILDDAELREETKEKIAIEKARQEHLKLMQFTAKSLGNAVISVDGESMKATDVKVMGDATSGYIVNVAREDSEEPIRIPPSLSSRLKPHQVSGIRFLWENIIQSVRKVKSGDSGLGCILAHTMGLGKTIQVIAFLYAAMRSVDIGLRTAIIVTPVNVLHNWRHEFLKWKPVELKALRVFMMDDVPRERRVDLLARWRTKGGVLLIGYSAFRNLSLGKHVKDKNTAMEMCHSLQYGPDILICDEAHMIKNRRADITYALKQVKTQRRIALTGSPLQNNLMEYYCMVDFVREGFLGSSHEFRNRFQNPIENGQHANSTSEDVKIMNQRSHILYEQLKGFVQRMDLNVVKKDLPPKTVFVITVKLSPLQRKLYKRFLDVHGFTNEKVSTEKSLIRRCFFSGYQALAQIWNHPGLLQVAKEHRYNLRQEDPIENFLIDDSSSDDNFETSDMLDGDKHKIRDGNMQKKGDGIFFHEEMEWWEDLLPEKIYKEVDYSGKMVLLLDILSMSYEVGDKVLVFSQSLATLDLIELFLSRLRRKEREGKHWKQGKDWYRLDGRTDGSERQRLVEKFNDPMNKRVKCTLISTRAGSLGINLHAANRVVIVDGSWNPTNDLQAIYRVWRYGQIKPVYAYRLMAHGTMEEKIYKRQVTKEGLAARVVDRQQIYRTMSREEVLHLFDFGDDESADHAADQRPDRSSDDEQGLKQNPLPPALPHSASVSDKFMETLLSRHHPRWIANYHEHETLLQENEEERLSKEEQDMAWETFRRSMEWEEVQRISVDDAPYLEQRQPAVVSHYHQQAIALPQQSKGGGGSSGGGGGAGSIRNRSLHQRKCSNLSHLLTLRSQGTKSGSSTVCGECLQEISWESLNRDGKSR